MPVQKGVPSSVSRSPVTSGSRTSFSPPPLRPNTVMRGLSALRRIKHRLSDDFDAFCRTIFGQTPPPAGKRFFFATLVFSAPYDCRAYRKPSRHAVFTVDRSVFCFFSTSRCSSRTPRSVVGIKRSKTRYRRSSPCTFYLVIDCRWISFMLFFCNQFFHYVILKTNSFINYVSLY